MQKTARFLTLLLVTALGVGCTEPKSAAQPRTQTAHVVNATAVTLQALAPRVVRTGTLRPLHQVKILTREEGQITKLPFFEGDRVKKGAVLVQLDDSELQAQLNKAQAQRRQAALDLDRLERLQGKGLVTDEALTQARTALDVARAEEDLLRVRAGYTRIRAPFAGVVTERLAEPGDVLPRLSHVLTFMDPDALVTEVNVSELLLPSVGVGDQVDLRIDALGDTVHRGRILRIHPAIDPATRQGTVEVALDPAPKGARAGQMARLTIEGRPVKRKLIPFAALRRDPQGEYVFRVVNGRAEHSRVVSGLNLGEQVEILQGLKAGDQVVVRGFLGLRDGSPVKVVGAAS